MAHLGLICLVVGLLFPIRGHSLDVNNAVCAIAEEKTGGLAVVGSGFFLESSNSVMMVVTAAHVVNAVTNSPVLLIRAKSGRPLQIPTAIVSSKSHTNWIFHPEADLAALPLSAAATEPFLPNIAFFTEGHLWVDAQPPEKVVDLEMIGFPTGCCIDINGYLSPVSKISRRASALTQFQRADTKTKGVCFYLQDPSVQGLSGGPVWIDGDYQGGGRIGMMRLTGPSHVVGVIHGNLLDNTGGKMAIVTPAFQIRELCGMANRR